EEKEGDGTRGDRKPTQTRARRCPRAGCGPARRPASSESAIVTEHRPVLRTVSYGKRPGAPEPRRIPDLPKCGSQCPDGKSAAGAGERLGGHGFHPRTHRQPDPSL